MVIVSMYPLVIAMAIMLPLLLKTFLDSDHKPPRGGKRR
jgi:hypothetical protein